MKLYQEILDKSKLIDKKFEELKESEIDSIKIIFNVPKFHPRSKEITKYTLSSKRVEDLLQEKYTKKLIFIIDDSVSKQKFIEQLIKKNNIQPIILRSVESEVKTKPFLEDLIRKYNFRDLEEITLVIIGGGLLLNVGAYIAERTQSNLILFPTTVLSMADSAGGKVRVNFLLADRAYKHFYKSYYEPNFMFLDDRFLNSLPEKQIKIGLSEIIKHGLFQSPRLYNYLSKFGKYLFTDMKKLKKAILWSANLKKACLDIDVEENENGEREIKIYLCE
ncbi:MAG: hypothetical protein AABY10_06055, partial [Nanoarchaeota archaeon]